MNGAYDIFAIVGGIAIGFLLVLLLIRLFRRPVKERTDNITIYPATIPEADRRVVVQIVDGRTVQAPPVRAAPLLFTLSRNDLLDHVDKMRKESARFPILASVKKKDEEPQHDYLMCGQRCFAVVFVRNDFVYNLILCMSKEIAKKYADKHIINKVNYLPGNHWYNLIK